MNVPDTVIYENEKLTNWYFTSGGIVKRKNKEKLN